MSYKIILNDIKQNSLKPIYLCYGVENYLKSVILDKLVEKYIDKAFYDLNYIHIQEEVKAKDIINACETLPFMSEKKIVVIEDCSVFSSKSSEDTDEDIINYIKAPNQSTCLIFYQNVDKVDNRRKIVKLIKKHGTVIELNKINERELYSWINKEFKEKGKKINLATIEHFVSIISYYDKNLDKSMFDIKNEITKICDYYSDKINIGRDDVEKVITKSISNNIFKLVDAIGQKNTVGCLEELNNIIINQEPIPKIMYMIIRQFRLLAEVKLLTTQGYNSNDIAKKMKTHVFIVKKLIVQSRNFTYQEIKRALVRCLQTDKDIKTSSKDNRLAVEMLIIDFAS
ncbi:DNA polymerase III subunit delta [Abyssisolibacter fermentans]|uniref:DNA polymerase III subunit delta n=1 Tax=Abyssisolibacter fermentans TaxID=1766203 RepID=UPI00082BF873|nr:DNA polymerase III subunit delta [Abyssisolibacter fermentans]